MDSAREGPEERMLPARRLALLLGCLCQFAPPSSQVSYLECAGRGVLLLSHHELKGIQLALLVDPTSHFSSATLKGQQLLHVLAYLCRRQMECLVEADRKRQEERMGSYDAEVVMTARDAMEDNPATIDELEPFQEAYVRPLLQSTSLGFAWFAPLYPLMEMPTISLKVEGAALLIDASRRVALTLMARSGKQAGQLEKKPALGQACAGEAAPAWLREIGGGLPTPDLRNASRKRKGGFGSNGQTIWAFCRGLKQAMAKNTVHQNMRGGGRYTPQRVISRPSLLFQTHTLGNEGSVAPQIPSTEKRYIYLSPVKLPDGFLVLSLRGDIPGQPAVLSSLPSATETASMQGSRRARKEPGPSDQYGLTFHPTAALPPVFAQAISEVVNHIAHAFLEPASLEEMGRLDQIPPPLPLRPRAPLAPPAPHKQTRYLRPGATLVKSAEKLPLPSVDRPPLLPRKNVQGARPQAQSFEDSSSSGSGDEDSSSSSSSSSSEEEALATSSEETVQNTQASIPCPPLHPVPPVRRNGSQAKRNVPSLNVSRFTRRLRFMPGKKQLQHQPPKVKDNPI